MKQFRQKTARTKFIPACLALVLALIPGAALAQQAAPAGGEGGRQCREILETVEFPESLFIQDDTGRETLRRRDQSWLFRERAAAWLLDGIHLKVLAGKDLNGEIWLYRTKSEDLIAENGRCRREQTALKDALLDMEFEALRLEHEGGDGAATGERLEKLREEIEAKKKLCDRLADKAKRDERTRLQPEDLPPIRYRIHILPDGQMDIWDHEAGRRIAWTRPCAPFGPSHEDRKFRDERGVYDYWDFVNQVFFYLGPKLGEGPSGKPRKRPNGAGQ